MASKMLSSWLMRKKIENYFSFKALLHGAIIYSLCIGQAFAQSFSNPLTNTKYNRQKNYDRTVIINEFSSLMNFLENLKPDKIASKIRGYREPVFEEIEYAAQEGTVLGEIPKTQREKELAKKTKYHPPVRRAGPEGTVLGERPTKERERELLWQKNKGKAAEPGTVLGQQTIGERALELKRRKSPKEAESPNPQREEQELIQKTEHVGSPGNYWILRSKKDRAEDLLNAKIDGGENETVKKILKDLTLEEIKQKIEEDKNSDYFNYNLFTALSIAKGRRSEEILSLPDSTREDRTTRAQLLLLEIIDISEKEVSRMGESELMRLAYTHEIEHWVNEFYSTIVTDPSQSNMSPAPLIMKEFLMIPEHRMDQLIEHYYQIQNLNKRRSGPYLTALIHLASLNDQKRSGLKELFKSSKSPSYDYLRLNANYMWKIMLKSAAENYTVKDSQLVTNKFKSYFRSDDETPFLSKFESLSSEEKDYIRWVNFTLDAKAILVVLWWSLKPDTRANFNRASIANVSQYHPLDFSNYEGTERMAKIIQNYLFSLSMDEEKSKKFNEMNQEQQDIAILKHEMTKKSLPIKRGHIWGFTDDKPISIRTPLTVKIKPFDFNFGTFKPNCGDGSIEQNMVSYLTMDTFLITESLALQMQLSPVVTDYNGFIFGKHVPAGKTYESLEKFSAEDLEEMNGHIKLLDSSPIRNYAKDPNLIVNFFDLSEKFRRKGSIVGWFLHNSGLVDFNKLTRSSFNKFTLSGDAVDVERHTLRQTIYQMADRGIDQNFFVGISVDLQCEGRKKIQLASNIKPLVFATDPLNPQKLSMTSLGEVEVADDTFGDLAGAPKEAKVSFKFQIHTEVGDDHHFEWEEGDLIWNPDTHFEKPLED